jgi:hypothetical protein
MLVSCSVALWIQSSTLHCKLNRVNLTLIHCHSSFFTHSYSCVMMDLRIKLSIIFLLVAFSGNINFSLKPNSLSFETLIVGSFCFKSIVRDLFISFSFTYQGTVHLSLRLDMVWLILLPQTGETCCTQRILSGNLPARS